MRFLIIDDDISYITLLEEQLNKEYRNVFVESYHEFPNINQITRDYDVIFLDIIINHQDSIEFAKMLKKKFENTALVFISSRSDFIFQTQEIDPLCFIRKSDFEYDFSVFKTLFNTFNIQEKEYTFEIDKTINRKNISYINLLLNEIIFVECYFHELIIHTYKNEYVVKMTLKSFLNVVDNENCFIQIHRRYAVNMNYVYMIEKQSVFMIDKQSKNELEIGRTFKDNFFKVYKEFIL